MRSSLRVPELQSGRVSTNWRRLSILLSALSVSLMASPARAAGGSGAASDAQPGIHRVGVAERAPLTFAATLGYGMTEPQGDARGYHHRLSLKLASAAALLPWLSLAPAIGARQDWHRNDSGSVLDASLAARVLAPWHNLRLGAELKAWVPGAESASLVADSASLDARGLFGARWERYVLAFAGGYRFDRSAAAGKNAARLGPGDRLALGLSSFDAVLLGAGSSVELGASQILLEVSADVLVGKGAPSFTKSPLRATAGVRQALSERWSAELLADVTLSARPGAGPADPLVPIEPRFSALAGLRYRFAPEAPRAVAYGSPAEQHQQPEAPATPAPAPAAPSDTTLELSVVDGEGVPVDNARVRLWVGDAERTLEPPSALHRLEHVPAGALKVAVEAPGFEPFERSLSLEAGKPQQLRIDLKALPPPSQVRGSVRSFGGKGLVAHVRVEPLGIETTTTEGGGFQIDVPPGGYDVVIEAKGYQSQRRKVTVDPQGVVILNAELTKKR
jgi:hypothetical protein